MTHLMIFSFIFCFIWIGLPLGILFNISRKPWMKRWSTLSCSVGLAFLFYYIGIIGLMVICAPLIRAFMDWH